MIRDADENDARSICDIYNHYIENSPATFEVEKINVDQVRERMNRVQEQGYSWIVAEDQGEIVGYAYSSRWMSRAAYQNTVEVSVYISHQEDKRGWGTQLYNELFSRLKKSSVHTVIGIITLPNPASIALHEKFGMVQVAHLKQVGFKFGKWIDVGYWQVQLGT